MSDYLALYKKFELLDKENVDLYGQVLKLKDENEQLKARLSEAEKVLSWMADRAVESHAAHSFVKRAQTYFDKYNK